MLSRSIVLFHVQLLHRVLSIGTLWAISLLNGLSGFSRFEAQQLRPHAPGLTPRSVLDKFSAVQMIDVEIPTTDGRTLQLTRYTEPPKELKLLLQRLHLELPAQPPPKINATQVEATTPV